MILDEIISTEETPDYPVSQMLSDFGGVFGFCMGLSLLTFINAIEWAFKSVFKVKQVKSVVGKFACQLESSINSKISNYM